MYMKPLGYHGVLQGRVRELELIKRTGKQKKHDYLVLNRGHIQLAAVSH